MYQNYFNFGMTLYMFRTVFPSIVMSSRLYIQQKAFVTQQRAQKIFGKHKEHLFIRRYKNQNVIT